MNKKLKKNKLNFLKGGSKSSLTDILKKNINHKKDINDKKDNKLVGESKLSKYFDKGFNMASDLKKKISTSIDKSQTKQSPLDNHLTNSNDDKPKGIIGNIKHFFKTDFYFFIKNYLYFIVLFSICFYIILYINNNANSKIEVVLNKIFFYVIIIFLFIVISDILESPLELQQKFLFIILFSLILVYIFSILIEHFYKKSSFNSKLLKIFLASLFVFVITVITIYFTFQKKEKSIIIDLYNSFNYAMGKNFAFLIFLVLYIFIYKNIFSFFNSWNSSLTDILCPSILGLMILFFIFIFIIYIAYRMKVITKLQYLNTFISLSTITFFLVLCYIYIFMKSLKTVCITNEIEKSVDKEERVCIILIVCIFIILWYDDVRDWHTKGSILFLFASLFGLYCMFIYSTTHPSITMVSMWFFIEWLIIIFYRKQNSKNSFHFSFMDV